MEKVRREKVSVHYGNPFRQFRECSLFATCSYHKDHPKYTDPQLDPYTECIDYYELRKKYTNKSTRSNKEK